MSNQDTIVKTSDIHIKVGVNENNVPIGIHWTAEDGKISKAPAKAMMLAVWDEGSKNTMKIDLWTKEMSIEEMKQFFHQTLVTMADSFERATGEAHISEDLRDYCLHFAKKMEILPE